MNKYFLLGILLIAFTIAKGQNKASIKGRIIDSLNRTPVEFATVAALEQRDTTSKLISYTLSDKNGAFTLHNLPENKPVKLLISYVAYEAYRKIFTFKNAEVKDLGDIEMIAKQLKEVVIKGERLPVTTRKDTIVFDAEAFKTRPNAVVEDLLKKLPGVEVDQDGKITVMAKAVSKVLVDGHRFFPSDIRMATKNIDADMISKVEVYDDREDDPDHLIPQSQVNKVINLRFKKLLKKSIFGKAYAGAGTGDHYQGGGLLNMFRDTLQVSLLGYSNNLNNTGFDYSDLYAQGGLNRGGSQTFGQGGFFGGGSGKQTATAAGVNINTDYGKKLQINFAYLLRHVKTSNYTVNNRQQLLGDTTAVTQSINNGSNVLNSHAFSSTFRLKPSDATLITYYPSVNITQNSGINSNTSNSYSNFINPINNAVSGSNTSGNSFQFQHSFNYNHQFNNKGESIDIDHTLNLSPNRNDSYSIDDLTSYVATLPSYSLHRLAQSKSQSTNANVNLRYRYPVIKKLILQVDASTEYSKELNRLLNFNYNPVTGNYDSLLVDQSSDLTRKRWTNVVSPGITYEFAKNVRIDAHLDLQSQLINNAFGRNSADVDRHYFFLLPRINLNINNFYVAYSKSAQLPNIGDMVPYSVVFSPVYSVTGNPDLKATTQNYFSLGYNKYNFESGISYSGNARFSYEQNGVFRQRTVDADLVETSTPINKSGRYTYGANFYVSKRFKKKADLQVSATTNAGFNSSHNFFVLNRQNGYQDNFNFNISESLIINYKDVVQIEPRYTVSEIYTKYTGVDYPSQNYISHYGSAHFNFTFPYKLNLDGDYAYKYNPMVAPGFQKNSNLLNLSLARQLLKKDRGEIRLSCYDIFNQNISTSRSINENVITDTQAQIIKRYFMLTLQYKFNKSVTK
ncbi:TonB-dependent receptor [Mucilaginibacter sp. KACC 22063]|uniref:TonB-dependent receptor n=1 Tax=Mucilaginibacter sp. KACC 22063 TaxID=3025666 RepID=UPI0023665202|nr:TonB-dependent receptor [Mucilaginibacter sp. KACC 22063]WDF56811.1 TonB-dependent receptor [Mucilaginibacter sp. KACC 22063]